MRAATQAHLAHAATLDLAIENALDLKLFGRLPEVAVELAQSRRLALFAAAATATLRLGVIVLAPPPHLPRDAVTIAAGVAIVQVVGSRAMRLEEQLLQQRAVGSSIGLGHREAGAARSLEGFELILR